MSLASTWPVPFVIDPQNFAVDAVAAFCASVLVAVLINAEAQAFTATFLGDARTGAKDRFHFNAFRHLDILGTLSFLVGGFGWPRTVEINPDQFAHPRLYTFLTRLSGPLTNIFMANIASSLFYVMKIIGYDSRVFPMVAGVNVTMAVYNLVPLPPLAAGILASLLIPQKFPKIKGLFLQAGPFLILALLFGERLTHQGLLSPYINPLVESVFKFILG
jgi:Zn-dependent protease